MPYLLKEYYELCDGGVCQDFLTEEEKSFIKEGGHIVSGVMQRAEARNGNGRVYPRPILEREVKAYKKAVNERRALGSLDHSDSNIVELSTVSHLVRDIWWEGQDVMGKVEILNTPPGKVLQELLKSNVKLGISSRGLGSVNETANGDIIVEDDYQLICFDMVSEPSTAGAFMAPQMVNETQVKNIFSKADRINRALNEVLKK